MGTRPTVDDARWLTPTELRTWRSLSLLLARLPALLGSQLQYDANLSFVEYYVLAGLSESRGRAMRLSQVAVLTNSELSRMSHLVNRLEKRGLVRREPDPHDGRSTNVVLTDGGFEHLAAAAPAHVEAVRRSVFDILTEIEQHALQVIAAKITAGLSDK